LGSELMRRNCLATHSECGVAAMNRRKLLQRILQGSHQNISYSDLTNLPAGLGFHEARIRGSHHFFVHPSVPERVNLQAVKGQGKSYQIRQIVRLIERYNPRLEDES
jgi:predicted RNA binding protein YcfA (HicA-like mRNA interferase family)